MKPVGLPYSFLTSQINPLSTWAPSNDAEAALSAAAYRWRRSLQKSSNEETRGSFHGWKVSGCCEEELRWFLTPKKPQVLHIRAPHLLCAAFVNKARLCSTIEKPEFLDIHSGPSPIPYHMLC